MKTISAFSLIVVLLAGLSICSACKKKSEEPPATGPVPVVTTVNFSKILINTVDFSGNVTADGGAFVNKRGFCWSNTNQNPTIQNDTMVAGDGAGAFAGTVNRLKGQCKYYVRAYATNSNGTGYGSILTVSTIDTTITDIDNNRYRIVQIGNQVWMAENLKTTRFNNGNDIQYVTDSVEWCNLTLPGYCYYDNNPANATTYGALYNWNAVNWGNLAPAGWHVPSDGEWVTLINYLGGLGVAGGKMKEAGTSHWLTPNAGADNSSGFSALPGGRRVPIFLIPSFTEMSYIGSWWTLTEVSQAWASVVSTQYDNPSINDGPADKKSGFNVRCIRD